MSKQGEQPSATGATAPMPEVCPHGRDPSSVEVIMGMRVCGKRGRRGKAECLCSPREESGE